MQHAFTPGQIILDKYRIERVLGAGGMGVVLAARHLALDQLVAIKFMLGFVEPIAVRRFIVEARIGSRLRSQHAARVLDVDAMGGTTPYMVLEYLEGKDLATVLRERGPLPFEEAVDAMVQVCEALAEAHALGIIHRDLKPANIFLTRALDGSPCAKVIDFGIAKLLEHGTQKMDVSQIMGSAPYMAPEQIRGEMPDVRTDVWALGCTLFQLLTGSMPFAYPNVTTPMMMITTVITKPPLEPRELRPELPQSLEAVLLRCLEKDPARRFPDVAVLAAALVPFGSEQSRSYAGRIARVLGVPAQPAANLAATAPLPELTAPEVTQQPAVPAEKESRKTALAVLLGALLLVLLVILSRPSPSPPVEAKTIAFTAVLPTVEPRAVDPVAPSPPPPSTTSMPIQPAATPAARAAQPPPRRPSAPASTTTATSLAPPTPPREELYGRRR